MYKRILSCLLISGAVFGVNALASEITDISYSGNTVTVEVKTDSENGIAFTAVKSGVENRIKSIYAALERYPENETVSFKFTIPDTRVELVSTENPEGYTDGEFVLTVKDSDGTVCQEILNWVSSATRENAVKDFSEVKTDDELKEMLNPKGEYYNALIISNINADIYASQETDVQKSAREFYLGMNNTALNAGDNFSKALGLAILNDGSDKNLGLELLDYSFENISYDNINDEKLKEFIQAVSDEHKKYSTFTEAEEMYINANILYLFNNAKYSDITDYIKKYHDEIGISASAYDNYNGMSSIKKTKVNDLIVEELDDGEITDVDDLADIVEYAIDEIKGDSNKKGGSSGGGGSGGGKSNNITKVTGVAAVVDETKESETVVIQSAFNDLYSVSWAVEAINVLNSYGIVSGDGNGSFEPNRTVKREEFVKMIVLAMNVGNEKAENKFSDIDGNAWYADYILRALNSGIINGISETEFGIGNDITRQDMCVIVRNALNKEVTAVKDISGLADFNEINDYAKESVKQLYEAGIVNGMGDGTFAPKKGTTRAEAAVLIYRIMTY